MLFISSDWRIELAIFCSSIEPVETKVRILCSIAIPASKRLFLFSWDKSSLLIFSLIVTNLCIAFCL